MSDMSGKQVGAFGWNELGTRDIPGTKRFYGDLLGWHMRDVEMGGMDYTIISTGDVEIGGIVSLAPDANTGPAWGAYVTVRDVDALLSRVEQLGGKIRAPAQDIPDVGRFAVIQDPQGALLSLISYFERA